MSIAYILVTATYMLIGVSFYIAFPLPKSCIEDVSKIIINIIAMNFMIRRVPQTSACVMDHHYRCHHRHYHDLQQHILLLHHNHDQNLLNNFHKHDVLTVAAKIFLFFQMLTVFPLIMYILRYVSFLALSPSFGSSVFESIFICWTTFYS